MKAKDFLILAAIVSAVYGSFIIIEGRLNESFLTHKEFIGFSHTLQVNILTVSYFEADREVEYWESLIDSGHKLLPWEERLYIRATTLRDHNQESLKNLGELK